LGKLLLMGKLNILHHKEWHVYSKGNRDKVKEDEKKAAEESKKAQDRINRAESEAKLEFLRKKALAKKPQNERNINFFEEEERCKVEYVKSDKEIDQKKWEDKHTWYLGETKDGKKDTPWYIHKDFKSDHPGLDDVKVQRKKRAEVRRTYQEDPLTLIQKATGSKVSKQQSSSIDHKRPKTIEELRKDRLERELQERARTRAFIKPQKNRHEKQKEFFNAQFHPDLVQAPNKTFWYQ
jgi:hypothetical protein